LTGRDKALQRNSRSSERAHQPVIRNRIPVIPDFKLGFPEASYSAELDSTNTQPAASQSSLGSQPAAGTNRLPIIDLELSASLV
jgi:hypothetical protein